MYKFQSIVSVLFLRMNFLSVLFFTLFTTTKLNHPKHGLIKGLDSFDDYPIGLIYFKRLSTLMTNLEFKKNDLLFILVDLRESAFPLHFLKSMNY